MNGKTDNILLVIGDLSGIQNYIFNVSESGGGQAKRLRSRSFIVQAMAEVSAAKVLDSLAWTWEQLVFSNAGKFLLSGPASESSDSALNRVRDELEKWLLEHTGGELGFSLAWQEAPLSSENSSIKDIYNNVQFKLQRAKFRPWANVAQESNSWNPERLILSPLDTPCSLCRRAKATDKDEEDRDICHGCKTDHELGRKLPISKLFLIQRTPLKADRDLFGYGVTLSASPTISMPDCDLVAVANLSASNICPSGVDKNKFLKRQLARYIPTDNNGSPVQFSELAQYSRGDKLLGVLKADVDSLGVAIGAIVGSENGLAAFGKFSQELDSFFAGWVADEMKKQDWDKLYTVFAGGDDLLLIGPWNILFDFAAHLQQEFSSGIGSRRHLTLSAGLALIKPKRPIKQGVEQSETLLERAKTEPALGAKDQFASFGQCWKWSNHQAIVGAAKQLANWIKGDICERGWVQTLLRLTDARLEEDLLSTSHLAYFIARNFPKSNDRNLDKASLRRWADNLLDHFDSMDSIETQYLRVICRYALTATRELQISE